LPFTRHCIYMNTGHACSPPLSVLQLIKATLEQESYVGAASNNGLTLAKDVDEHARRTIGDFVGVNFNDLQITHSTREGVNIILYGLKWQPGDELLICDLEHASISIPAKVLAHRYGVRVIQPKLNTQEAESSILHVIKTSLSRKTRLIALSHIQYGCGLLMPIREIARVAHDRGVQFFVDGAQSVGHITVNIQELECDFYAFSGQKWLMGPVGTGALYVHSESRNILEPLFTTNTLEAQRQSWHPPLSRFALTSQNAGLVSGLAEAVRLINQIGIEQIEARSKYLSALLRNYLKKIPVKVLSAEATATATGIVTVNLDGWSSEALVAELRTRFNITARAVGNPEGVRFCTAYFNTEEEVEQVAMALEKLASEVYTPQ
jgi:selenocysteine lyase/cysteine desulfurase